MVDAILAELGIEVVEEYGDELSMRCPMPWHDDRHPSAQLNASKLAFQCWSCQSSGGLLWFLAVVRGAIDPITESPDWAAMRAWLTEIVAPEPGDFAKMIDAICAPRNHQHEPLPRYSFDVLAHLTIDYDDYLLSRGIPEKTLSEFLVGADTRKRRVVLPILWKNSLVGWQSRRRFSDGSPKYQTSPGGPTGRVLYGEPSARPVVVESPFSVLRHAHHQPMTATFGASVTPEQLRWLHSCDRVTLFFDPDPAGWRAIRVVGDELVHYTGVFVASSPDERDPADLDDETLDVLIGEAVPYPCWQPPEGAEHDHSQVRHRDRSGRARHRARA
jgi:hypothetical protein